MNIRTLSPKVVRRSHLKSNKNFFAPTDMRTVCPSSIPAGTGTLTRCCCLVCPPPPQSLHGCLFANPFPWHRRQVDRIINGPVCTVSIPVPLHCGHLSDEVPGSLPPPRHFGQLSMMFTEISFSTPLAASRKFIFILYSVGCPKSNWVSPNPPPRNDLSPKIVLNSS